MLVSITEYQELARDLNGAMMPVGGAPVRTQRFTSDGQSGETLTGTKFARIATDSAIWLNGVNAPDEDARLFLPGVEYISTRGGRAFTVALA